MISWPSYPQIHKTEKICTERYYKWMNFYFQFRYSFPLPVAVLNILETCFHKDTNMLIKPFAMSINPKFPF